MIEPYPGLPETHPEFCLQTDIDEQERLARFELLRKYHEDCTLLRADLVLLAMQHGALVESGSSWMLYYLDDVDSDEGIATISGRNEVLVMIGTGHEIGGKDGKLKVADIRIATNQHYRMFDGRMGYLTQDFTLDEDNDCQYALSTFDVSDEGFIDMRGGDAPLFYVDASDHVKLANFNWFTHAQPLAARGRDGKMKRMMPLGHFRNLEDSIYALAEGRALYEMLRSAEPHRVSRGNQQ